jgi:putative methyltransferase
MYMALNVLISQPNLYDSKVFMPLVFLCLKTYVDKRDDIEPVNWLDPLFRNTDVDTMLKDVNINTLDVLGISCYDWNWNLNLEIAQRVKQINPNCKVIAGGPHPDWKDSVFFLKYPFIDAIVYQDGEIPFAEIIKAIQHGDNFDNINNLILPTKRTPPGPSFSEFELSPWLENKEWILEFKRKYIDEGPNQQFTLLWETDRGCPFKCTFCDWGSATNSKVRRFPMERIIAEIDFFTKELGVDVLYHVGANLGIFPRDLEFVEYICEKKKETGFPKSFQYSTSKNTPERTVKIAEALYNAKLLKKHVVSLQHTVQDVLDCIDRYNIPVKRQIPMIRDLNAAKMPCISQMIMGMPGDNYELWIKALTDTIEWGIHFECRIYDFQLLPNSPAAQPEYMKKWNIETRTRNHFINGYHKMLEQDHALDPHKTEFIVSTSTYTLEDWLQMKIFGKMFMALHGGSVTKWTSMFCRNTLGISYFDFYKELYEDFFKNPKFKFANSIYSHSYNHFKNFLNDDNSTDELKIDILHNEKYYQLEEYILWNCLFKEDFTLNDIFWNEFEEYLKKYNSTEIFDLIDFNKQMFFTLDYDHLKGKEIKCKRDWFSYIEHCTWNCVDNTEEDFDISKTLIDCPEEYSHEKIWFTEDEKLGAFPMGPNQDSHWNYPNIENRKENFADCILAPTYMRGTRTVFNRGRYV